MVNRNIDSIIYQATIKLGDICSSLAKNDLAGVEEETSSQNKLWQKAINVYSILKVINDKIELSNNLYYRSLGITDDELNTLLAKLVNIANIVNYPIVSSLLVGSVPIILTGLPGNNGDKGDKGDQGLAGYATDFLAANKTSNFTVDSFLVSAAKAVKWEYFIIDASNNQRTSSVIAQWTGDGLTIKFADTFGPEDVGTITGLTWDVQFSGGNINLVAVITSGTWTIVGTRYFIPNNGNGSGAVNNVLPHNQIYVGNISNQATAQTMSQDATINAAGQLLISAGAVTNAKIAVTAGIVMTKLAALTANRVTITDVNGFIVASSVLNTELAFLSGATSNIQAQLNALAISLTANRPVITNGSGALTSNPALSTNRIIKWNGTQFVDSIIQDDGTTATVNGRLVTTNTIVTSSTVEAQAGIRTGVSGSHIKMVIATLTINLDTVANFGVTHGLDYTKILGYDGFVYDNTRVSKNKIGGRRNFYSTSGTDTTDIAFLDYDNGGTQGLDAVNINITRRTGGGYDSAAYNNALIKLIIWYEA